MALLSPDKGTSENVRARYAFALNDVARVHAADVFDGLITAAALAWRQYEIARSRYKNVGVLRRWRARRALRKAGQVWRTCRRVLTYTLHHALWDQGLTEGQLNIMAWDLIRLRIEQLDTLVTEA